MKPMIVGFTRGDGITASLEHSRCVAKYKTKKVTLLCDLFHALRRFRLMVYPEHLIHQIGQRQAVVCLEVSKNLCYTKEGIHFVPGIRAAQVSSGM